MAGGYASKMAYDNDIKSASPTISGEIERELNCLDNIIDVLDRQTGQLVERLRFVLQPEPPSTGGTLASGPTSGVPLAAGINILRTKLSNISQRIEILTGRIDL